MSVTLKVVIRGDTIRCDASITEYDGITPLDPDSHLVKLYKPDGVQEGSDEISPTYTNPGEYSQLFTLPADGLPGRWRIRWRETTGGKHGSADVYFDVIA